METFKREYDLKNCFMDHAKSGLHYDVIIVTKEKLQLRAHKAVLCRDLFWYNLLKEEGQCSRNCASLPTTVMFPDYDYSSVRLMLTGYYQESVDVPGPDLKDFLKLVRSFNTQARNIKCRICDAEMQSTAVEAHLNDHVKTSLNRDINKYRNAVDIEKETIRCSFTHPNICTIEKDRGTMTQGIYNNVNISSDEDMIKQIKQHYRRHLRDELSYITGGNLDENLLRNYYHTDGLNSDCEEDADLMETMPELAARSNKRPRADHADRGDEKRQKGSAGNVLQDDADEWNDEDELARLAEDDELAGLAEDDDNSHSGGMSSPDLREPGPGQNRWDTVSPIGSKGGELKRKKKTIIDSDEEDDEDEEEGKRSRQSSGNNTLEITKVKCKLCSTEVTKHFFRQHLTSAHFIDKWQINGSPPYFCNAGKCDGKKKWTNKKVYIKHRGTVHKEIDDKLAEMGETIADYEENKSSAEPMPLQAEPNSKTPFALHASPQTEPVAASKPTIPALAPQDDTSSSSSSATDIIKSRISVIRDRRKSETEGGTSGLAVLDLTKPAAAVTKPSPLKVTAAAGQSGGEQNRSLAGNAVPAAVTTSGPTSSRDTNIVSKAAVAPTDTLKSFLDTLKSDDDSESEADSDSTQPAADNNYQNLADF